MTMKMVKSDVSYDCLMTITTILVTKNDYIRVSNS